MPHQNKKMKMKHKEIPLEVRNFGVEKPEHKGKQKRKKSFNLYKHLGSFTFVFLLMMSSLVFCVWIAGQQREVVYLTNENVVEIVRESNERNDSMNMLSIMLVNIFLIDQIWKKHNKKVQGSVKGVKI